MNIFRIFTGTFWNPGFHKMFVVTNKSFKEAKQILEEKNKEQGKKHFIQKSSINELDNCVITWKKEITELENELEWNRFWVETAEEERIRWHTKNNKKKQK